MDDYNLGKPELSTNYIFASKMSFFLALQFQIGKDKMVWGAFLVRTWTDKDFRSRNLQIKKIGSRTYYTKSNSECKFCKWIKPNAFFMQKRKRIRKLPFCCCCCCCCCCCYFSSRTFFLLRNLTLSSVIDLSFGLSSDDHWSISAHLSLTFNEAHDLESLVGSSSHS